MPFEKIKKELDSILKGEGYSFDEYLETGLIYVNENKSTCLKIDIDICNRNKYQYISYTSVQNELVNKYDLFLRFSISTIHDLDRFLIEFRFFTKAESEPEKLKQYGANREELEIDPTLPEATFEECFSLAFGEKNLYALTRESRYYDFDGKRRYIDYVLKTTKQNYAIELNGEAFHHPAVIKEKRYASQLFKQNSLSAEGYKVFRWSQRGMADKDRFIQEIKLYFGEPEYFESTPHFKSLRYLKTFLLAEHQHDALAYIDSLRDEGRNTFIIVLPTATGKTEIFIEDIYRQSLKNSLFRALVLVPRNKLVDQTISRFKERYPDVNIGNNFNNTETKYVCIQTYAYILRHYHENVSDEFDYIVVDEAHHAQANGLKRVLEYYNPKNLLGFTATDQRLDQKRLEDIFGQYETQLTLKEAMQKGLVPPVSVYRLETSIDLSNVRFNGKDFVKSDLQKSILISSRDEMIVSLIKDAFRAPIIDSSELKQGLVFCVDIKHANRVAELFNKEGINAAAVSGQNRIQSDKALNEYKEGGIQFLCACDLLNEGWDSPQTSILVMARPTMSKVLYMQQLGRGLRHDKKKERVYVIDVVDSYGAKLQSWSAHGLFGIRTYIPFGDLLGAKVGEGTAELQILSGLYEQEIKLVPLDIFTMQEQLADMLSEEQLARELFVSTGTVRIWLKRRDIDADYQLPFGRRTLSFFSRETLSDIRKKKNINIHTDETRKEDFIDFVAERDYTFSYKMIFLCLMFKLANERGEVDLPKLTQQYSSFYKAFLEKNNAADRENSPVNKIDFLGNENELQKSILKNPFEKFERKRFMHHCTDLNYICFDSLLWRQLETNDILSIQEQMFQDLTDYYEKLNLIVSENIRNQLQFISEKVDVNELEGIDDKLKFYDTVSELNKYTTVIPYYPIEVAAGNFADSEIIEEPASWLDISKTNFQGVLTKDLFVTRIKGHSMEPTIPDGSYCLFKYGVVGSRNGRVVLAKKDGVLDKDFQTSFTVKRYFSEKMASSEFEWRHKKIELRPDNPEYDVIEINEDDAVSFLIVAEFIQLLRVN